MAWEDRNGRKYYYRKRRQAGRVISTYVGGGDYADLVAGSDSMLRAEQARQRTQRQAAHAEFMTVSRLVDQVSAKVRTLTRAALLSSGFHLHRGQWRRRRE